MEGSLPLIPAGALPSGKRLGDGHARRLVEVAAAAPPALRRQVEDVRQTRSHGYVAQLRGGPEIWLGDLGSIERKWKAATAILADPSSEGADYIDVRLPERAVAGGVEDGAISAAEEQAATATPAPQGSSAPAQTLTAPSSPVEPQGAAPAASAPAPQAAPQQAPAQSATPSQQPQP